MNLETKSTARRVDSPSGTPRRMRSLVFNLNPNRYGNALIFMKTACGIFCNSLTEWRREGDSNPRYGLTRITV